MYAKVETVNPPDCACQGKAPQMREHTKQWCSIITQEELAEILSDDNEPDMTIFPKQFKTNYDIVNYDEGDESP